jgi:integrase
MSPATIHKLTPRPKRVAHRKHDKEPKLVMHSRDGVYYAVFYEPDPARPEKLLRRFKSTGTAVRTEAEDFLKAERDRLGAVARGHEKSTSGKRDAAKIADLFPLVEADYIEHERGALRTLRSNWKCHVAPDFGAKRIESLVVEDVTDARKRWLAGGMAKGTVNRCVAVLHRCLTLGVEKRKCRMPDFVWPEYYDETLTARDKIVTEDELARVNAAEPWAAVRDKNGWGYTTGMRHGEITKLEWSFFDHESMTLTLPPRITKTKKGRVIAIPDELPELRAIMARRWKDRRPGCPLIFHHDGASLGRPNRWTWAWKRAGLPMKTPKRASGRARYAPPEKVFHDLRRTAVRNMLLAGVPEKSIMKITGHKSRRVFDAHYNVIDAPETRAALAMLGTYLRTRQSATRSLFVTRPARPVAARQSKPARPAMKSARRPARAG